MLKAHWCEYAQIDHVPTRRGTKDHRFMDLLTTTLDDFKIKNREAETQKTILNVNHFLSSNML